MSARVHEIDTLGKKREIDEAEQQQNQATSSKIEPNTQTGSTTSLKMVETKKMVAPGTRDAPKFSSKKPQELRRFLRVMEDLWKEAGITEDKAKKQAVGKYADPESEEEWIALDTYETGTWEEFKDELIENYPEAAAAERGTPARIRQLCSETRNIALGDLITLFAFRRSFIAEARKLSKPPAAMSNRELVELFLGCLSNTMASAVLQFLGNINAAVKKTGGKETENVSDAATSSKLLRRPEDQYDIDEVCKAAIQVSENSQGMLYLMNKPIVEASGERGILMLNQPVNESKVIAQKLEELEGVQALERDRLVSVNKSIDAKFSELEAMMKTMLAQAQGPGRLMTGPDLNKPYDPNSGVILGPPGTIPKWGKTAIKDKFGCFYCGRKDHFIPDCEDVKEDLQAGLIRLNAEGKLRLRDGSQIPGSPIGTTIKERVLKHYARQHATFHFGEYETEEDLIGPSVPRYPPQFVNLSESADKRRARLEQELDLREKEEALELRKLKLEREEKKLDLTSKNTRSANVLDLLEQLNDEEIAAIKASKSGFP